MRDFWVHLKPFRSEYAKYLIGTVLRQALLVAGGYSLVLALRMSGRSFPEWLFILAFVAFDAGYLGFDNLLNFRFVSRISYPLFRKLRVASLRKVFQMPLEWHQRQSSGALTGKVNDGVGKVVQTTEGLSRELVPSLIQTLLCLVPLVVFSRWTVPAVAIALSIFLWMTVDENRRRQPLKSSRYKNYARDFGLFAESVQSVQAVVQYGQSERLLKKYGALQDRIVDAGIEETRIGNRYSWRRNMVISVAKRGCQGLWLWQYRRGRLDAAMVMYLNMLTEQLLSSFWSYAGLIERIAEGMQPAQILMDLLNRRPAIADAARARPLRVPEEVGVRLNNVWFGYRGRKPVLRNFDLDIRPGSIVGIVGRSGAGKTTIHGLLSRMYDVQGGAVTVAGADVRIWPLDQLRSLFSYVVQGGGMFFTGTRLMDVIRFARPEATFRDVVQAAKAACIHDDIARMPLKYKTRIGQGGVNLSRGQQQRLALAQALLSLGDQRKVLVLDEFTSQLDSETEARILDNILPYLCGRTVIIIAHRISTIRRVADEIIVLDQTGIAEHGTHEELMELDGWYAGMARLQGGSAEELEEVDAF